MIRISTVAAQVLTDEKARKVERREMCRHGVGVNCGA